MIRIIFYCNYIFEVIVYYYKIFKSVNCLLQQHIYNCIKILIKIFRVYSNGIFFFFLLHISITSTFIATTRIKNCNDTNVIAMISFIVINIFSYIGIKINK